jgi:hypothetical protein
VARAMTRAFRVAQTSVPPSTGLEFYSAFLQPRAQTWWFAQAFAPRSPAGAGVCCQVLVRRQTGNLAPGSGALRGGPKSRSTLPVSAAASISGIARAPTFMKLRRSAMAMSPRAPVSGVGRLHTLGHLRSEVRAARLALCEQLEI